MEELKHTKGPWIIKGDQVISTSVRNIDWSAFGNRAPIGASDITLICTLPMQMNYKDAPYNGLLISLAPEMLESLIKAHNELISISRLQDWHSESFRTVIEEMERTIEAATDMKIEEVLEATARHDAWKPCPFCGHLPEIITCERGAYTGLSRAFHKCKVIGYIEIQDWSVNIQRGKERWNSRVVV